MINIKEIKKTTVIKIPGFDGINDIEVEVRRPQLIKMVEAGEIPNPLMGAAYAAINGFRDTKTEDKMEKEAMRSIEIMGLYCKVCLVNPSYEEMKEYITDEQRAAITAWAITPTAELRRFHNKQENN